MASPSKLAKEYLVTESAHAGASRLLDNIKAVCVRPD
jgi:hypothetical protein